MLSILIPVFNFDVTKLVHALHAQCTFAEIIFEILVFDDGSTDFFKKKNKNITNLTNIVYRELAVNHGRSKIRNLLGKTAKYDYLLYLDGDTIPADDAFINKYLQHAVRDKTLCGGIAYDAAPPKDESYQLHWHYGRNREVKPATIRNQHPYHSFLTGNFFIPRAIFLAVLFEEKITGYGHEDTVFGFALKTNHYPILHIDNPVTHLGLEPAATYLKKSRKAISNLVFLQKEAEFTSGLHTKLLSTYDRINHLGLSPLYRLFYRLAKKPIERNLTSKNPSLFLFDLWKLGELLVFMQD